MRPETPDGSVFAAIVDLLEQQCVSYRHVHHEATRTSEESARVRGEPMRIGGKSLVLKAGDRFVLLVLSAELRASSKALRRALGVRRVRFATREELLERTRCVPGCVPPFGQPITELPLLVDVSVLRNDRIAFNAGSLEDSIVMSREDWKRIVTLERVVDVAEAPL